MKHKDKSLEGWGRDKARERYADGGTAYLVGKDSINKLFDRATEPVSKAIKSAASSVKERFNGKPSSGGSAVAAEGPTIPKIDYDKYKDDTPAPPPPPEAEPKNLTDGRPQRAAPVPIPRSRPAPAPSAAPAQASPAPAEKEGFKAKNFQDTFTMKRGGLAKKKGK